MWFHAELMSYRILRPYKMYVWKALIILVNICFPTAAGAGGNMLSLPAPPFNVHRLAHGIASARALAQHRQPQAALLQDARATERPKLLAFYHVRSCNCNLSLYPAYIFKGVKRTRLFLRIKPKVFLFTWVLKT